MANAADFANVLIQLILTNFELLMNSFSLLLNNSVDVAAIWNVSVHAAGFGYWFTKPFVGDCGSLDIASRNVSAMKNISYMINRVTFFQILNKIKRATVQLHILGSSPHHHSDNL